jgi:hypothetical protein
VPLSLALQGTRSHRKPPTLTSGEVLFTFESPGRIPKCVNNFPVLLLARKEMTMPAGTAFSCGLPVKHEDCLRCPSANSTIPTLGTVAMIPGIPNASDLGPQARALDNCYPAFVAASQKPSSICATPFRMAGLLQPRSLSSAMGLKRPEASC